MTPRRPASLVGAALLAALPAFGAPPVELDVPVFEGGYGIGFYVETARRFEAVHPGVGVHVYGDPRIQDQLRVRIVDGSLPDAAWVPYILWPSLIRAGRVVDLRRYLDERNWEGDARWGDTFQPGLARHMEGRRRDLRAAVLLFLLEHLLQPGDVQGPRLGGAPHMGGVLRALRQDPGGRACAGEPSRDALALSRRVLPRGLPQPGGARGVAGHERTRRPGAWADPRVARGAEILRRVTRDDVQAGWEGETAQGAELYFLQGRAAMTVSGSWFFNEMSGKIPQGFDIGTMNFPVFADGVADPSTVQTGSDCFFVFNTGDRLRERLTVDFLRFLTSRSRAEAFVRETDAPVAVRGVPLSAYSARMRDDRGPDRGRPGVLQHAADHADDRR